MILKLKKSLLSLSISKKIMASMVFIVLVLCIFLTLITNRYFTKLYLEDTYEKSKLTINVSEQAFIYNYMLILDNVNEFTSSSSFQNIITNSLKNGLTISHKAQLQEGLFTLNQSSPYIDSAVVVTKEKDFVFHFNQTLKEKFIVDDYLKLDDFEINGVTFLPMKKSPFTRNNEIIPMIFPIEQLSKGGYLRVAYNYSDADIFLVLFLNVNELDKILKFSSYDTKDSKLILANHNNIINISSSSQFYNMVNDIIFKEDLKFQMEDDTTKIYEGDEYMIYTKAIEYSQLQLINIVSKKYVINRLDEMKKFMFLLGVSGVLFATILSLMLSKFLTKPFGKLMEVIKKISEGVYKEPNKTLYDDEIGRLNNSLNFMYDTIKQQFEDIKNKESAKFQAELNLLSEQVNPHFLYNTLECINMEVLCNRNDSASEMLSDLSSFLRIGLNYGNNVILFHDEVQHAQSYLNIINYRFNHKINFTAYIDDKLKHWRVIKYILQPLIENSIIHGFGENINIFSGTIPEITINTFIKDDMVVIEVNDNGIGIDILKAESVIYSIMLEDKKSNSHFGLYNVYQRLLHYYGNKVAINFESIPMFKNSVIISIPFKN